MMEHERIIGDHSGPEKGPLLICFAGMHGNEPAGIEALEILFKLLELEPESNPDFRFWGRIVGLRGNLRALQEGVRFIEKDLNRQWTSGNVERIRNTPREQLQNEDLEVAEILDIVDDLLADYQPETMIMLDLHTTTAHGGIFSIATDDPESVRIGVELHAPVIKGLLKGISGTTLHYFNDRFFPVRTIGVTFESGQHEEHLSVNRAIAAVINCMRTIGNVKAEDVENRHDKLLIDYSRGLPKVAELIMCHTIEPGDGFEMRPGYRNFQKVRKGEWLATDRRGKILAREDGLILMPLYQKQGDDGFFLIRSVVEFEYA